MRSASTAAEAALWQALRRRRLGGRKFRRQQVIAGYIVDFYCAELWLAVEVDGAVHDERHAEDRQREEHLSKMGLRIVRIRNEDVLTRIDAVLTQLAHHCQRIADEIAPK